MVLKLLIPLTILDKIFLLQPEAAPLYVLVSKLNKRVAISTTVEWPENDLNPSWSSLAASATSAATNFTVASQEGYYFNVYDLVKIPSTGEIVLVTAIAACAVTAVRGFGATAAASAASSSTMVIIGPAFEEGSSSSALTTKSRTAAHKYNYLQTIRKSVEVTNTMLNSELYGGNYRAYERKVKGIELMRDIERMALYGERLEDTTLSSPTHARRTSGGADYFISTNVTAVGGILTESDFEAFIRTVTRYGGDEVYLLSSPLIISVISQWAQGKIIALFKSLLINGENLRWQPSTSKELFPVQLQRLSEETYFINMKRQSDLHESEHAVNIMKLQMYPKDKTYGASTYYN